LRRLVCIVPSSQSVTNKLGCDGMNSEEIKLKVLARDWTFKEISNIKQTVSYLADEIYNESKLIDRFELVRETKINEGLVGYTIEDAFRHIVKTQLNGEIAGVVMQMLEEATINFGGNKNEVSERSVGGESHQERTTDEEKNSEDEE